MWVMVVELIYHWKWRNRFATKTDIHTYTYNRDREGWEGGGVEGRGQEEWNEMRGVARYIEGCILAAGKKKIYQ